MTKPPRASVTAGGRSPERTSGRVSGHRAERPSEHAPEPAPEEPVPVHASQDAPEHAPEHGSEQAAEGPAAASAGPHRVAVLVLDGVIPFELGIPQRIFGRARGPAGEPLYTVTTCGAVAPGPVRTTADFAVLVEHGPEILAAADTVVVPASYEIGSAFEDGTLPPGIAAAFARIRPGTRLVSICTGSFVLAAAGLLDGRPATTHWSSADRFQRLYPRIRVDPNVLFVDDGDVLTSAGVAAGIDLCLHIVRRDHGTAVANEVARHTVVPPFRDGGQAQYIERPLPEPRQASTARARAWALARLHEPISLRDMAERESMSVRTFTRRFREEAGLSPGQWLVRQRVERARQLLESTDLSVDRIARDAGFGTAQSMRQHLQGLLGVVPTAYRRTFRASTGLAPAAVADPVAAPDPAAGPDSDTGPGPVVHPPAAAAAGVRSGGATRTGVRTGTGSGSG